MTRQEVIVYIGFFILIITFVLWLLALAGVLG